MLFGDTLAELRRKHSENSFRQLSYSPVYFSTAEVLPAIDLLERLAVARIKLDPLQALAVRMLIAETEEDSRREK
jgi:hypothetical protein